MAVSDNYKVSIEAAHSSTSASPSQQVAKRRSASYVSMIATAILESSDLRLNLAAIYNWIEKQYPYCRGTEAPPGWRNSIRHNLSLNDCFIKVGRCEDGKGNYWSIHPSNMADFRRGDFKQRQSRRRSRKSDSSNAVSYSAGVRQVITEPSISTGYSCHAGLQAVDEHRAYRYYHPVAVGSCQYEACRQCQQVFSRCCWHPSAQEGQRCNQYCIQPSGLTHSQPQLPYWCGLTAQPSFHPNPSMGMPLRNANCSFTARPSLNDGDTPQFNLYH